MPGRALVAQGEPEASMLVLSVVVVQAEPDLAWASRSCWRPLTRHLRPSANG
jgi:hypothetical protein